MKTWMLILFGVLLLPSLLLGQEEGGYTKVKSATKSLQIAQQLINAGKYKKAKRQLKYTIKRKENFAVAFRELGHVCLQLRDYQEAIEAFEQSFDLDPKISRAAFFECAEAMLKMNQASKALFYYNRFVEMKEQSYVNAKRESGLEQAYESYIDQRFVNCRTVINMGEDSIEDSFLTNLGGGINSKDDDYMPTLTPDRELMIFTRKRGNENEDILRSRFKGGKWKKVDDYIDDINTKTNEGMTRFATHGETFYFAGCHREDTEGGCDIYEARFRADETVEVTRLEGNLNSHYWDSQPTISCDGKRMFFSSSRPEGNGGADIWISYLLENGNWSLPQNAGPSINTLGDEEAPFIAPDGKTLYFTSTGHDVNMGDGDLFISVFENGSWSPAQNLGTPYNSTSKELGIWLSSDGKTAFLSSDRPGGHGGLDMYQVDLPEDIQPAPVVHISGKVIDPVLEKPVSTAVHVSQGAQKQTIKTDDEGWFFVCLQGKKAASFRVTHPAYKEYIEAVYLNPQDNTQAHEVIISLQGKNRPAPTLAANKWTAKGQPTIEVKQFFFEINSSDLDPTNQQRLDKLASRLQKELDWNIEVVGYADSQGDKAYNLRLSEQRASNIVAYLKNRGIPGARLVQQTGKGAVEANGDNNKRLHRRVDVILKR